MNDSRESADLQWRDLADLEERESEALMETRYRELAALPEEERVSRLTEMERAVYELPEEKIRSFTISRLRVWLALEQDLGQMISKSYDEVTNKLPGPIAMRHIALVQTLSREFSGEDQDRLRSLFPRIFGALPPLRTVAADLSAAAPSQPASAPAKKPWWAFWSR